MTTISGMTEPLMTFDSHVAGKNATVAVYPDRIEWGKTGWLGTGSKAALGLMTAGLSLAATGLRGNRQTQTVLMRSIHGVTTRNSGLAKREVVVNTSAGELAFRCTPAEAERFQQHILNNL